MIRRIIWIAAFCSVLGSWAQRSNTSTPAAAAGSSIPPADVSSCEAPKEINFPQNTSTGGQLPFFDAFSWKSFAALICDGKNDKRDPRNPRGGAGPRVFETYTPAWQIFQAAGAPNPCSPGGNNGELVIASLSKFVDVLQPGPGKVPLGPLPAQNGTYVRFLTLFNDNSTATLKQSLKNPQNATVFDTGSVNVKTAWVDMAGIANPKSFYTRQAWIRDSEHHCVETTVGLVGFHIVQKVKNNPRWVWSTFEHIMNSPDDVGPGPYQPGYTFHDTTGTPMAQATDNIPFEPPKSRVNVVRWFHLVSEQTKQANALYQAEFARSSDQNVSRWRNYELVMTQWGIGSPPSVPDGGLPAYTFPGTNDSTAFANTVMETFFQKNVSFGCMGCHGNTAAATDFVWSLAVERPGTRKAALDQVRTIIRKAGVAVQ